MGGGLFHKDESERLPCLGRIRLDAFGSGAHCSGGFKPAFEVLGNPRFFALPSASGERAFRLDKRARRLESQKEKARARVVFEHEILFSAP